MHLYNYEHYQTELVSGSGAVALQFPVNRNFVVYSPYSAIFNHVVHVRSLEPGETPSSSASHQDPNFAQRSKISENISKRFGSVAVIFSIYLCSVL